MIDLRLGDALVTLRDMPDASADMIWTDPPYRNISGGNGAAGRPVGILSENNGTIFEHNDIDVAAWAPELFRVLTSPGHCYVMTNMLNLWRFHEVLTGAGFRVHNLLVWHKNTVTPNRWYMKNAEYILFLRKGPARTIYTPGATTVISARNVTGPARKHPTEKPVELVRTCILASSSPGETVLDPFMGAGSAASAARDTGRRFIGCEIDPVHYAAACVRLGVLP